MKRFLLPSRSICSKRRRVNFHKFETPYGESQSEGEEGWRDEEEDGRRKSGINKVNLYVNVQLQTVPHLVL